MVFGDPDDPFKSGSIGLGSLDCATCTPAQQRERGCRKGSNRFTTHPDARHRIDYHRTPSPGDFLDYCPRSISGVLALVNEVYRALAILRRGIQAHYGCAVSELPYRVVRFLEEVEAADLRFDSQRLDLERALHKRTK